MLRFYAGGGAKIPSAWSVQPVGLLKVQVKNNDGSVIVVRTTDK